MTLEHFAHIVSHDLKAPLNGIASLVDFVVEDYADRLDDAGREQLHLIQSMAVRGVAMIDALRRFSRLASVTARRRPLDLTAVVTRAIAEVCRRQPEWRVETHVDPLPAVAADPALVPLLFEVLVDNGLRYSTGAVRRVTVTRWPDPAAAPGDMAAIAVTDDGIGIPAANRREVFAFFKRLHTVDAYGGGVGAGLAMAERIVDAHGGRIWVVDREGPGTTVVCTLPLDPEGARTAGRE